MPVDTGPGALVGMESQSGMRLPDRIAFWRSGPGGGAHNMAVDAAMVRHVRTTGGAVWRCYRWSAPTVSFGRNERVRERFSAESVAAAGLDAVRRPTGGRALLHAREVTYSVAFPLPRAQSWRAAYHAVNRVLLDALRELGVPAIMAVEGTGSVSPDGPLCFDLPAPGEITVHKQKLVGSAVWRDDGVFLQHGSILLHDDQARLVTAGIDGATAPVPMPPPAAALAALLPGAAAAGDDAMVQRVEAALEAALARSAHVTPFTVHASFTAGVDAELARFQSPGWLWRR